MNFDDLKKAIEIFKESGLTYMEFEQDGMRVAFDNRQNQTIAAPSAVVAPGAPTQVAEENSNSDNKFYVTSPLVGTYHQAASQGAKPFVSVGQKVKKGDKLCIIEAMKVMNEITATKSGEITEILVSEGQMVEFDQKLFVIGD
ncbi:MAG: acetyl-CoA carboxylase biotin carboxyl carrier protein [Acholeplasmatales bacterium]|nr:acetyl-CoA carboxylase biotin carboxyl carrier protein [Acholeplasmatales bacterium]